MKHILILWPLLFPIFAHCRQAIITGEIKNTKVASIKCSFIPGNVFEVVSSFTIPVKDGNFSQTIAIKNKAMAFLSFEEGNNYYGGFVQSGDSIHITYDATHFETSVSFSGHGKMKFLLPLLFYQGRTALSPFPSHEAKALQLDMFFKKADSITSVLTAQLNAGRQYLSNAVYQQLDAYLMVNMLRAKYNGMITIYGNTYHNILRDTTLSEKTKRAIASLLQFNGRFSKSYFYVSYLANLLPAYYNDNIRPNTSDNPSSRYQYLYKKLPKSLRSPILFLMLEKEIKQNINPVFDTIASSLFSRERDKRYQQTILQRLRDGGVLKSGMPAPEFTLENIRGQKVRMNDLRNKVVLLDFWFAACGPCHKLFNDLKAIKTDFRSDSNVVFLTVSVDNRDTWEKALARYNIQGYHVFTENRYRDHPAIKAYHVTEYPTIYLIGKGGIVLHARIHTSTDTLKAMIISALKKTDL